MEVTADEELEPPLRVVTEEDPTPSPSPAVSPTKATRLSPLRPDSGAPSEREDEEGGPSSPTLGRATEWKYAY